MQTNGLPVPRLRGKANKSRFIESPDLQFWTRMVAMNLVFHHEGREGREEEQRETESVLRELRALRGESCAGSWAALWFPGPTRVSSYFATSLDEPLQYLSAQFVVALARDHRIFAELLRAF